MIRAICKCKAVIYIDSETGHKFASQSTDDPHSCEIPKISLFKVDNGVHYPRKDEYISRDITNTAVEHNINPFTVKVQRQGDYLVIKA